MNDHALVYLVADVARMLDVSEWSVYEMIKRDELPGVVTFGSQIRVVKRIFDSAMGLTPRACSHEGQHDDRNRDPQQAKAESNMTFPTIGSDVPARELYEKEYNEKHGHGAYWPSLPTNVQDEYRRRVGAPPFDSESSVGTRSTDDDETERSNGHETQIDDGEVAAVGDAIARDANRSDQPEWCYEQARIAIAALDAYRAGIRK